MKRLSIIFAIMLISVLIITGCGTPATPATPTAPTTTTTPAGQTSTTTPGETAPTTTPTTPTKPGPTVPTTPATPVKPVSTAPVYGGTLTWVEASAPSQPIGSAWEAAFAQSCMQLSYEPLLKELADGTLLPRLAESYEVNNDPANPSLTFHLKKGVKFHDGTPFNAQAVIWYIQKLKDSGLWPMLRYYKSFNIVDDYTIFIPMTEWRNSLPPSFAKNMFYMVSPTAYEKNGPDWMRWRMVGTGPFKQVDFQKDVSLTVVRNDDYWQAGKPYLLGVKYLFVADEMTRVALWKSGGADVMNLTGNGRLASELEGPGNKVVTQVEGALSLIPDSANADSPWSNLKVRQAAEYAIDKEGLAKAFGFGYWQAASQVPSPSAPAYIPTLQERKYDSAKAKQLLAEAGYPSGFKTTIIAQNTDNKDIIVALQSQLAAVGIQVDLDFVEPMKLREYQTKGWNNGLLYTIFGMEGNCIPAVAFNFSPVRTGRYLVVKDPPGWREAYDAAGTSAALEPKLIQKYTQLQYDDAMLIPLVWQTAMYIVKDQVHDHGISTLAVNYWEPANTWLSK